MAGVLPKTLDVRLQLEVGVWEVCSGPEQSHGVTYCSRVCIGHICNDDDLSLYLGLNRSRPPKFESEIHAPAELYWIYPYADYMHNQWGMSGRASKL